MADRSVLASNSFETFRTTFNSTANDVGDIADFNAFQIKIRMRGTDSTNPPIIKRLRVVATG